MSNLDNLIIPALILFVFIYGLCRNVDTYQSFVSGARSAVKLAVEILPFLATILIAIHLFSASGLLNVVADFLSPIFTFFGIPSELAAYIIIRPFSGSGSVALFDKIVTTHGPDHYITRVASVVAGSSETVFYISAIYFSKTKIKNLGTAIPIALLCTFLTAILAAWIMLIF